MQIHIKSKRTVAIVAVVAALLILLAGAFAWNNINQQRINTFRELVVPGVTLHDDFDDPNKDVYVENSGDVRVLVRVRLTEFLQTAERGSLVAGHERYGEDETDNARLNWTPHSGVGGVTECCADEYHVLGGNWPSGDWFHEYYEWTMGGQKYYMPVKAQLTRVDGYSYTDVDGNVTEFEDGYYYTDSDGNLVNIDDYICDDHTEYDGTEDGVKQTLPADVITMQSWLDGGKKQGEFWVVDTDGWCYWAQMLEPETATGLLLDTVTRTGKAFDSSAEYCINVWLQAVDEIDVDLFRIEQHGGITENGLVLTRIVTGTVLVADNGDLYENNRNGTFTQISGAEGFDTRAFVPMGVDGDVNAKIESEPENRLYVGKKFDLEKLVWDGENFINYDTENAKGEPWYNLEVEDGGAYTLIGTEIGADGVVYLHIQDSENNTFMIASVTRTGEQEPYAYSQSYPGSAPFGVIYQGGDKIGTNKDKYYDAEGFEQRFFYHIGTGVYVEVEDANGTASYDDYVDNTAVFNKDDGLEAYEEAISGNTRYYFSTTIHEQNPIEINNYVGTMDENMAATFYETLQIGEFYGFYRSSTSMCIIYKGDEMRYHQDYVFDLQRTFTMKPLFMHNGKLYFPATYDKGDASQMYDETARSRPFTSYLSTDNNPFYIKGLGTSGEFGSGGFFGQRVEYTGNDMVEPTNSPPSQGDGTQSNPWQIVSRNEMEWITSKAATGESFDNQYFKVMNDFSMKVVENQGQANEVTYDRIFQPIGSLDTPFLGHFDGAEFTISDLVVDTGNVNYAGLFGYVGANGRVEDVTLENVNIQGLDNVGGIAGRNAGMITNCAVTEGAENAGAISAGGKYVGGIAGYNVGTVQDCENNTVVSGGEGTGGVVGTNFNSFSRIYNCENNGGVIGNTGANYIGGIAGGNNAGAIISGSTNTGDVTGKNLYTGGVVGNNTGKITSCSSTVGAVSGWSCTGGIVGYSSGTTAVVEHSYSTSDVNAPGYFSIGGVVGQNHNGAIVRNCYATGNVIGKGDTGGIVGCNGYPSAAAPTITSSYHAFGSVYGEAGQTKVGGIVGYNHDNGIVSNCVAYSSKMTGAGNKAVGQGSASNCYTYNVTNGGGSNNVSTEPSPLWWATTVGFDFDTVWKWDETNNLPVFDGASVGTAENPFLIRNRADMDTLSAWVAAATDGLAGKYFKVANDFDMGSASFTPIGSNASGKQFKGTFDGNGMTISDLMVTSGANYAGLFVYLGDGSTVTNLTLSAANISGTGYLGSIAGCSNGGTVTNCTVSGSVLGNGDSVGGIVGRNLNGTITSCTNYAEVTGGVNVGGIAGIGGNITGCTNNGAVTGKGSNIRFVGGIVGNISGIVENCHNTGAVTADVNGGVRERVGGIAGILGDTGNIKGEVKNCSNSGDVVGATSVGGVVGMVYNSVSTVENSVNTGAVTGSDSYVGGVVGNNSGSIKNCYAWGNVTGGSIVGGVVGNNSGTTTYSYHAKGTISKTTAVANTHFGGLIGQQATTGKVQHCVAYADAFIGSAGGYKNLIIGSAAGTYSDCYYRNGLTLATSGGWAGTAAAPVNPNDLWWATAVGFDFANVWKWDTVNNLPVLQGVTS